MLAAVPGLGSICVRGLLAEFGSAVDTLRATRAQLTRVLWVGPERADAILSTAKEVDPEAILARAEAQGIAVWTWDDEEYPELLHQIHNPPPVLYVWGGLRPEDHLAVAVVGARRCTDRGRWTAERLGAELAHCGFTVVSGLARGIDSAAHRGAVREGRSIAVLGSGCDVIYPWENRSLAAEVAGHGAVVSEYAPGTLPKPENFPARNRIISGLSRGVVVVEATDKSGALLTVAFAVQQNRDVFAVPGYVGCAGSRGPHRLLREGATLVETVEDIVNAYHNLAPPVRLPKAQIFDDTAATLVSRLLAEGPKSVDFLAAALKRSVAEITVELTMLELDGRVKTCGGGRYSLS